MGDLSRVDRQVATRRRVRRVGLAVLAASTLLAASCAGKSEPVKEGAPAAPTAPAENKVGGFTSGPPDSAPVAGGKIVYGIDAEPEGLNPVRYAFSQAGHTVASAVFEPLATLDENGQAVPYLATGFEHSDDNKTWTIVLPTEVKFHDGTAFDADAVLINLNAYKTSAIDSAAFYMVESFAKKDATHVEVKLNRPMASFPSLFTTQAGYMLAPKMMGTDDAAARTPVGTGPFIFDRHEDGKIWAFRKNPAYRQKGLPYLESIDFVPIINPIDRNDKLRTKDLDVIQSYTGQQVADLRAGSYKVAENRYGDKSYIMLNTTKPPFDNVTARRAVARATNAVAWRKEFANVPAEANSPYGPGQPGYLSDNGFPSFDLDEAKKLVKQYEAEVGKPLEITFLVANDTENISLGQKFSAGYEAAGMKVTLDPKPQINLLAGAALGGYEMSQFRVFAQPNPDADVHFYRTGSIPPPDKPGVSLNFSRYANPAVDKAVDEATATTDKDTRQKAYEKVNRIFADQVPMVWLGQNTWVVAANVQVNGVYKAANGSIATVGAKTWIAQLSVAR